MSDHNPWRLILRPKKGDFSGRTAQKNTSLQSNPRTIRSSEVSDNTQKQNKKIGESWNPIQAPKRRNLSSRKWNPTTHRSMSRNQDWILLQFWDSFKPPEEENSQETKNKGIIKKDEKIEHRKGIPATNTAPFGTYETVRHKTSEPRCEKINHNWKLFYPPLGIGRPEHQKVSTPTGYGWQYSVVFDLIDMAVKPVSPLFMRACRSCRAACSEAIPCPFDSVCVCRFHSLAEVLSTWHTEKGKSYLLNGYIYGRIFKKKIFIFDKLWSNVSNLKKIFTWYSLLFKKDKFTFIFIESVIAYAVCCL